MASPPVTPALRALADVGAALLRQSSSGRMALGRAAGLLPPGELEAALARARAGASEPLGAREVERALRDAWGRPPARVLDDLDLGAPVATTPLAQVHRGALDGEDVAVKLRRPGLDAALRADLALLDALAPALSAAFPRLDAGAVLAEIRERTLDELDFEHAAAQQRAAGRALRDTENVEVPATHLDLAAPAVMVSAWLDGPTLADGAPGRDGDAAALLAAHVDAARAGLVLPDARPNHVVLRPDGIGLLGTGAAAPADRGRVKRLLALLAALRGDDGARFADLLAELGVGDDEDAARQALAWLRHVLGPFAKGPAVLDLDALAALGRRARRRAGTGAGLAARGTLAPADLWLLRGLGQLAATLARFEASEDWLATASRGA